MSCNCSPTSFAKEATSERYHKRTVNRRPEASTQNSSGMFEIGEETICALMSMLTYAAPQIPHPAVPGYDALRLAFEATERKSEYGFNLHKYGIGYADEATQLRWEQWVACRAAILHGDDPVTDNTNQQFESLSRGDK